MQIPQGQRPKVLVSAAAFAAKYRSKRECYNFLAVDMGVYLPAYGTCRRPPSPSLHVAFSQSPGSALYSIVNFLTFERIYTGWWAARPFNLMAIEPEKA